MDSLLLFSEVKKIQGYICRVKGRNKVENIESVHQVKKETNTCTSQQNRLRRREGDEYGGGGDH